MIKSGVRWLAGRKGEEWWDGVGDDREFDPVGVERGGVDGADGREGVGGGEGEGLEGAAVKSGHYELDVNARHRLAIARLKLGEIDEAKVSQSRSILILIRTMLNTILFRYIQK